MRRNPTSILLCYSFIICVGRTNAVVSTLRGDFTVQEKALVRDVWPMELLEDPSKQAKVVSTAEDFLKAVLIGDHIEDIVVFPNGVDALGIGWSTVPEDLRDFLDRHTSSIELVQGLAEEQSMVDKYMMALTWNNRSMGGSTFRAETLTEDERSIFGALLNQTVNLFASGDLGSTSVYFSELMRRTPVGGWRYEDLPSEPFAARRSIYDLSFSLFSHDVKQLVGP